MERKIRNYNTGAIDISWDQKRCIHAALCVANLRKVFDPDKRPWIQPEHATTDELAQTVVMCPSGALHYHRHDASSAEITPEKNTLRLDADGPLYVRGDVKIIDSENNVLLEDTRVALCRCGKSMNKPLCDNSHIDAGFKAISTIPEEKRKFADAVLSGGTFIVQPGTNGPIHVTGDFEIVDDNGMVIYSGNDSWLCRCGGSQNKPFCDGTHNKNGFISD